MTSGVEAEVELYCADGPQGSFVCIEAESAEHAREIVGPGWLQFRLATQEETLRWDAMSERPLNERDVTMLLGLIDRGQSELARRFRRAREQHKTPDSRMVWRAVKLAELRGKLEMLESVETEPPQQESLLGATHETR